MTATKRTEKDGLVSAHTMAAIHVAHKIASQEPPSEAGSCTTAIPAPTSTAA